MFNRESEISAHVCLTESQNQFSCVFNRESEISSHVFLTESQKSVIMYV